MSDEERRRQGYENPLVHRWRSDDMCAIFSPERKFQTWRALWIALAEAEKELGLPISDKQIVEMERYRDRINFDVAEAQDRKIRHDVMAHVFAYGEQCPLAKPIIHLGATSAYVTDNTDLILARDALRVVLGGLVNVIDALASFARKHAALPTLGFTHLQPAQPTTVGKRACLWMQDLLLDLAEIEFRLKSLRFRGVKGTTGTQASFLSLFEGDHEKVRQLDALVAKKLKFRRTFAVCGQTYPRKVDSQILDALSGVAQSLHKFGTDLRLLQNMKEIEEPFASTQVGSSAMAYKRNPMRSERMCSLARYVMAAALNPTMTASVQWMERTLDDSANRRISIPEAFMAIDVSLDLALDVAGGLVVYPKMIEKRLRAELPFMATEEILMAAVKAGGDRQELHERIRKHSQAAAKRVKHEGKSNDLLQRIARDPAFGRVRARLGRLSDPKRFVGRAPQQVDEFLAGEVEPALKRHARLLGKSSRVEV